MNPEEIKFWAEVDALIKPVVPPSIEYRLHHNELGEITMCSMVDHPESMTYIVVEKSIYDTYFHYKIVKGLAVKIDLDAGYRVNLISADHGYAVVKNHAGLIVEPDETYNNIEHYAYRNN